MNFQHIWGEDDLREIFLGKGGGGVKMRSGYNFG